MTRLAIPVLAGAAVVLWSVPALADTIRVPADQPTIQSAVDAAQPGDVIRVGRGTFTEDVLISGRSDLRIVGSGRRSVISGSGVAVRIVDSEGITLQNLGLERADEAGVWVSSSSDVTVRQCGVRNSARHGILAEDCSRVLVDRCVVDDVGDDGISFSGSGGGGLTSDSAAVKCRVSRCGDLGIVTRGDRNVIRSCVVTDTGNDGVQTLDTGGDCETTVVGTRVQNTGDEGFEIDGRGTDLIRCVSRDARSDGFDVETDDCSLVRCVAKRADDDGYELTGANCRIDRCRSLTPQADGFDVSGPGHVLDRCTSVRAAVDGFRLGESAAGATLSRNVATTSGEFDLDDQTPPGSCTLDRNRFRTTNR